MVIILMYALTYGFNMEVSCTLIIIHNLVEYNRLCVKSCRRS